MHSFSSKFDCTNKFSINKASEDSPFQVADITHSDRNKYQVTFTSIKNPGNTQQNIGIMKYDELTFMLIKNRLHQYILHIQIK